MATREGTSETLVLSDGALEEFVTGRNADDSKRVNNARLSKYQKLLGQHLEKLNVQLANQIRDLQSLTKEDGAVIREDKKRIEKARYEAGKDKTNTATQAKEIDQLQRRRKQIEDEILATGKELEKCKAQQNEEEKQEREIRAELQNVSGNIGSAFGIQWKGAEADRTDTRTLKELYSRTGQHLSTVEKEKQIQDAYIARMNGDIELAENELSRIASKFEELKKERSERKSNFDELKEKLKIFEEGNLSLEDHFHKLMKTLQSKHNNIDLSQKEKLGDQTDVIDKLATDEEWKGLEEEVSKREAKLTSSNKARTRRLEQLARTQKAVDEAREDIEKCKKELQQVEEGLPDVQAGSEIEALEANIERSKKLEQINQEKAKKLEYLLSEKMKGSVDEEKAHKGSADTGQNVQATKVDNRNSVKQAEKIKAKILDYSRREQGLKYKNERLEKDLEKQSEAVNQARQVNENLNERLRKAEDRKNGLDKEPDSLSEVTVDDAEQKAVKELDAKLEKEGSWVVALKNENLAFQGHAEDSSKEVESWKKKTEAIENKEEIALNEARKKAHLSETRGLQNCNASLQRSIRNAQRELEMCALRRDFVVDRAQTTISKNSKVRSQTISEIQRLKERNSQLKQEIRESERQRQEIIESNDKQKT